MTALIAASRDALAKALAEHFPLQDGVTGLWGCMCEKWSAEPRESVTGVPWNHWGAVESEYHAHVAESLPMVEAATLVMPLFTAMVKAASPDDPTGHLPNCGYTYEHQVCGCAAFGERLHEAIATALTGEVRP